MSNNLGKHGPESCNHFAVEEKRKEFQFFFFRLFLLTVLLTVICIVLIIIVIDYVVFDTFHTRTDKRRDNWQTRKSVNHSLIWSSLDDHSVSWSSSAAHHQCISSEMHSVCFFMDNQIVNSITLTKSVQIRLILSFLEARLLYRNRITRRSPRLLLVWTFLSLLS